MNIFQAVLLSIVEGISEFLPISSTGHMILVSKMLGISSLSFTKSFEIIIQLGAIMAVAFIYLRRVIAKPAIIKPILIGFLPTGIIGFLLYKVIKTYLLDNSLVVVLSLALGGLGLLLLERFHTDSKETAPLEDLAPGKAFIIGLWQSISIVPGVSRAAATIAGGMLVGLPRVQAVEFSFLLAVPTMVAATGLDVVKNLHAFSRNDLLLLSVGFIGAFLTAAVVVQVFLKFVKTRTLTGFGIYRILVASLYFFFV